MSKPSSLAYGILGPVEAAGGSGPLHLGGVKQRALLAVLLVHHDEFVSPDRLIDALWGEHPPATAAKALQVHVSRLRHTLGADVVETSSGRGYRIAPPPHSLDLVRFEQLVAEGREAAARGDHAGARELLARALALWRGPPLADLAFEPFTAQVVARLDEQRVAAFEDRIDADLAVGHDAELVPELSDLVERHPLRERLRGQLMLALYRAGRQADALAGYRHASSRLQAELGLDPGPELQALERGILEHDPALGGPRRQVPMPPLRLRGARLLLAGGVLLGCAAASAALLGGDDGQHTAAVGGVLEPGRVAQVDPATGRVLRSARIAGSPTRLAVDAGGAWVAAGGAAGVTRLDQRLAVRHVAAPDAFVADLARGERALWLVDRRTASVVEVDPRRGSVAARIRLPRRFAPPAARTATAPWAIAAGAGAVWVTDGSAMVFKIDPRRRRLVRTLDLGRPLDGLAAAHGQLWATTADTASALHVDPRSGETIRTVRIAGRAATRPAVPAVLTIDAGAVWVLGAQAGSALARIDPAAHVVSASIRLRARSGPRRLAVGRDAVFVASADGTLTRIDRRTNAVRIYSLAQRLLDVGCADGRVWVTTGSGAGAAGGRM